MSCAAAWYGLHKLTRIAFVLHGISLGVLVIGFATPVWVSGSQSFKIVNKDGEIIDRKIAHAFGLWQACTPTCSKMIHVETFGGYFIATRFFACVGLLSAIVAAVCVFWAACMPITTKRVPVLAVIMTYLTALLVGIAVVVFMSYFRSNGKTSLSFSFGVTFLSAVLYFVSGSLSLVDVLRSLRANNSDQEVMVTA